jgi:Rrf2 family protein
VSKEPVRITLFYRLFRQSNSTEKPTPYNSCGTLTYTLAILYLHGRIPKTYLLKGVMTMNLSKSVTYGMIAMGHIAKQTDAPWVQSEEIAKKYGFPSEFLWKIMNRLAQAGILRSKRGPHGGFSLAKPAKEISLLEIIEAVEGPLKSSYGIAEQAKKQKFALNMDEICTKAADQGMAILKKAKLSDLVK